MSIVIAAAIIATSMNTAEEARSEPSKRPIATAEAPEQVARPASYRRATAFLAELDAGDWEGSWNATGPLFRGEVSLREWTAQVASAREPLGSVEDRKLVSVQELGPEQGTAERDMHVLQFLTTFEGRPSGTIETLFLTQGESGWEVTLYTVA